MSGPSAKRLFVRALRAGGLALLATVMGAAVGPKTAEAAIIERVVAVVGERPILLSELRQRARPSILMIATRTSDPAQQAAEESKMFRELLTHMVDERLEESAADKAHLSVTSDELDTAIRNRASELQMTPKTLLAEAQRQGLSEQDYRDELRRQILEAKLIELRVRGRVRLTDDDARAAYEDYAREMAKETPVDLRILALRLSAGGEDANKARAVLAKELVNRARSGEDFCKLVTDYSDDTSTKSTCGSHGPLVLQQLTPELQELAKTLKAGETSAPIVFNGAGGSEALLIVQSAGFTSVATYAEMKDKMMQRAYGDALTRQRKVWLDELRRNVYVDVRL